MPVEVVLSPNERCLPGILERMTCGGLSILTGRVLMPTREPRDDTIMAPLYPLSSSSSSSDSDDSCWSSSFVDAWLVFRPFAPSLLLPIVSPPVVVEVTELAAVKEFVTDVWVLPVQLVDAAEHSLASSSEQSSPSPLPLPSEDDDGSLSSGSKYFSVLFQDATARDRKAGVVFAELLSLFLPLLDDEAVVCRFPEEFLVFFDLSDAILAPRDSLVVVFGLWMLVLEGILLAGAEEGHSVTSCAGFCLTVLLSASSSSLAIEAYRLVLGGELVASTEAVVAE